MGCLIQEEGGSAGCDGVVNGDGNWGVSRQDGVTKGESCGRMVMYPNP